jgi:hypothetical protein
MDFRNTVTLLASATDRRGVVNEMIPKVKLLLQVKICVEFGVPYCAAKQTEIPRCVALQ